MSLIAGRLSADEIACNFADLHPPLSQHEAAVAADRCYFCHDAPCVTACPTEIDIPMFIRQIAAGRPREAGKTIWTRTSWEGCARGSARPRRCAKKPACAKLPKASRSSSVACNAMPPMPSWQRRRIPIPAPAATGRTVGVVGARSCRPGLRRTGLAMRGHDVVVYDARSKGWRPERIRHCGLQDR